MNDKNHIDDYFKKRLAGAGAEPPAGAWEVIKNKIPNEGGIVSGTAAGKMFGSKNLSIKMMLIAFTGSLVMGTGAIFYLREKPLENKIAIETNARSYFDKTITLEKTQGKGNVRKNAVITKVTTAEANILDSRSGIVSTSFEEASLQNNLKSHAPKKVANKINTPSLLRPLSMLARSNRNTQSKNKMGIETRNTTNVSSGSPLASVKENEGTVVFIEEEKDQSNRNKQVIDIESKISPKISSEKSAIFPEEGNTHSLLIEELDDVVEKSSTIDNGMGELQATKTLKEGNSVEQNSMLEPTISNHENSGTLKENTGQSFTGSENSDHIEKENFDNTITKQSQSVGSIGAGKETIGANSSEISIHTSELVQSPKNSFNSEVVNTQNSKAQNESNTPHLGIGDSSEAALIVKKEEENKEIDSLSNSKMISKETEREESMNRNFLSRCSIGLFVSPENSFRSLKGNGMEASQIIKSRKKDQAIMNVNASLTFSIQISPEFNFRTGISYLNFGEKILIESKETKNTDPVIIYSKDNLSYKDSIGFAVASVAGFDSVNSVYYLKIPGNETTYYNTDVKVNNYSFIGVPITLGYNFNLGRVKLELYSGALLNFLISPKQKIYYNGPQNEYPHNTAIERRPLAKMGVMYSGGLEINYAISDRVFITMGPSVKYGLSSIYGGKEKVKEKPYSLGLQCGIKYFLK